MCITVFGTPGPKIYPPARDNYPIFLDWINFFPAI